MIDSHDFHDWFNGSVVSDDLGKPILTYRGEHGSCDFAANRLDGSPFRTRLGSVAFGSARTASIYAMKPNLIEDIPISPRVTPAFLSIKKPVINRPSDPYIELSEIALALGPIIARKIAKKFENFIIQTNNWCDHIGVNFENYEQYATSEKFNLDELYFNAYALFDDHNCVYLFEQAGFDGAVYGGCGQNFAESEFRVFRSEQAWPSLATSKY